jgi:glucuronoarabinoxylan endo-1,4-beta-xylanase
MTVRSSLAALPVAFAVVAATVPACGPGSAASSPRSGASGEAGQGQDDVRPEAGDDSTTPVPSEPDSSTNADSESNGGANDSASATTPKAAGSASATDVIVNPATAHQRISGFGASTAWLGTTMSDEDADLAFSATTGAGLSLDRVRINYQGNGTSAAETATALKAQARGARVWATPWTPPVADKSNDDDVEGMLSNPSAFATFLVNYVGAMKAAGVNLYAVSAQNEPDANVTYESCVYSGASLAAFIGSSMGPAFAGSTVKVMGPETQNWCGFPAYSSAIESNASAWSAVSIIATHEYGCTPAKAFPAAQQAGKEFWETEIYDQVNKTADLTMNSGLVVANLMYDALANASMNAWHYWWFYPSTTDNAALWDSATKAPTKRLWVMGNFSRFVRPGFNRIDVSGPVPSGVSVIAFQNPADDTIAVVAINANASATALPLFVSGTSWPSQVTPWVTSNSANLVAQGAVSLTGARFSTMLVAQSVTTFVGKP